MRCPLSVNDAATIHCHIRRLELQFIATSAVTLLHQSDSPLPLSLSSLMPPPPWQLPLSSVNKDFCSIEWVTAGSGLSRDSQELKIWSVEFLKFRGIRPPGRKHFRRRYYLTNWERRRETQIRGLWPRLSISFFIQVPDLPHFPESAEFRGLLPILRNKCRNEIIRGNR